MPARDSDRAQRNEEGTFNPDPDGEKNGPIKKYKKFVGPLFFKYVIIIVTENSVYKSLSH